MIQREGASLRSTVVVPATCPVALHAYGDWQVTAEHVERLHEIVLCIRATSRAERALEELVAASTERAERVAQKIRAPLSPRQRSLFEDLDRMLTAPDDLAKLPRVFWMLGALAALAAVRAAYMDAVSRRQIAGFATIDLFSRSLHRHHTAAEERWSSQRRQIEARYPWIARKGAVKLEGLEKDRPVFVFSAA